MKPAPSSVPWTIALLTLLAAGGVFLARAEAQDAPEWKIGLAQVKITPEEPVFMAGYASRNKPFERVEADLYAKALALEDRNGSRAVLVTSDLLGFPAAIAEPIADRIARRTGLKREQILLSSSHCHSGPLLLAPERASPPEGVPAADVKRTVAYTRRLQEKVVDVAVRALSDMQPGSLSWGGGSVHFPMNRRQWTPNGVVLGANPRGFADRSVPVLRVDGADGKPRAVLFGAGVHNTTLTGDSYDLCGDYAGFAQGWVQEKHPGVQAMFMLGCAGDADPYPRGTMALAKEHGVSLGKEVSRVMEGRLQSVRGPLKVAFDRAVLPLEPAPPREELEKQAGGRGVTAWVAKQMLAALERGEKLPTSYAAPVAVWQFGDDLTLVGLSGEVVSDYIPLLEKALGPLRLWLSAYANDVYGYFPSARVLSEGGYECRGLYSGGIGYFTPAAQDVLVNKVRELAARAGRNTP
jgi:neutral ceramidase